MFCVCGRRSFFRPFLSRLLDPILKLLTVTQKKSLFGGRLIIPIGLSVMIVHIDDKIVEGRFDLHMQRFDELLLLPPPVLNKYDAMLF